MGRGVGWKIEREIRGGPGLSTGRTRKEERGKTRSTQEVGLTRGFCFVGCPGGMALGAMAAGDGG